MNAPLRFTQPFADLLGTGQTLKQFRDGVLERTANTGHYNGLRTLELREKDPIRYEKLFSKLRGGLVHARETAKKSPRARSWNKRVSFASHSTTPRAIAS